MIRIYLFLLWTALPSETHKCKSASGKTHSFVLQRLWQFITVYLNTVLNLLYKATPLIKRILIRLSQHLVAVVGWNGLLGASLRLYGIRGCSICNASLPINWIFLYVRAISLYYRIENIYVTLLAFAKKEHRTTLPHGLKQCIHIQLITTTGPRREKPLIQCFWLSKTQQACSAARTNWNFEILHSRWRKTSQTAH